MPVPAAVIAARREQAAAQARAEALHAAIQRAEQHLARGALDLAMDAVGKAAAIEETADVAALRRRIDAAFVKRQQEESDARATGAVAEARRLFDAGERNDAIKALEGYTPPHPLVKSTLAALRNEIREIDLRQKEAERLRHDEERRLDIDRRQHEEDQRQKEKAQKQIDESRRRFEQQRRQDEARQQAALTQRKQAVQPMQETEPASRTLMEKTAEGFGVYLPIILMAVLLLIYLIVSFK